MKITDEQLATWIKIQRNRCTDPRRRSLLEAISGWSWAKPYDELWSDMFHLTKKYGVVEARFITSNEIALGAWQNQMRVLYNDKDLRMTPERKKLLESISGWKWNQKEDAWDHAFNLTKKYGVVGCKFITPDGIKLGKWQAKMRAAFVSGSLNSERENKLNTVSGWYWKMTKDQIGSFGKLGHHKNDI
jgi:hypothetical protein